MRSACQATPGALNLSPGSKIYGMPRRNAGLRPTSSPGPQKELLATLREMERQGLKVIRLEDQDPQGSWRPLEQIDPFTFLATFNRGISDDNRRANWQFMKRSWSLQSEVPQDFSGIPTVTPLSTWFFSYSFTRKERPQSRDTGGEVFTWHDKVCYRSMSPDRPVSSS